MLNLDIGSVGHAFIKAWHAAGQAPATVRLQTVVTAAVARHGATDQAVDVVVAAIEDDPDLLLELLKAMQFLRPIVRNYVGRQAAQTPPRPAPTGAATPRAAGQVSDDTRRTIAGGTPSTPSGHWRRDPQGLVAAGDRRKPGVGKPVSLSALGAASNAAGRALLAMRINGQALADLKPGEALAWADSHDTRVKQVRAICHGLADDRPIGEQIDAAEAERRTRAAGV
jgi:hypothetical protein